MSAGEGYVLILTPRAVGAVQTTMPEGWLQLSSSSWPAHWLRVRVGLGRCFAVNCEGSWSARRGTYRVLYRINDNAKEVVVLRIDRRRDVYH